MGTGAQTFGPEAFAFIEDLDGLSTPAAVLEAMDGVVSRFGFERLIITGLKLEPNQVFNDLVFATRWPEEFQTTYNNRDWVRSDPVALRAMRTSRPFEWNGATLAPRQEARVRELLGVAAEFRIARGFVVPIHGPEGFEAAVGMSGVHVEIPPETKPALHLMAFYAYDTMRRLMPPKAKRKLIPLTGREREVLAWAAQGKSASETAEILKVAKRTIDEHAQKAMRKLGAANRTQAVAIALGRGLF